MCDFLIVVFMAFNSQGSMLSCLILFCYTNVYLTVADILPGMLSNVPQTPRHLENARLCNITRSICTTKDNKMTHSIGPWLFKDYEYYNQELTHLMPNKTLIQQKQGDNFLVQNSMTRGRRLLSNYTTVIEIDTLQTSRNWTAFKLCNGRTKR